MQDTRQAELAEARTETAIGTAMSLAVASMLGTALLYASYGYRAWDVAVAFNTIWACSGYLCRKGEVSPLGYNDEAVRRADLQGALAVHAVAVFALILRAW